MGTTVAIDMSFVLLVLGCLALLASGQECDVGGECVGTLLGFASTASITECLVQCKETANCTWFTHNGPDSFCAVYETCESVDATACPECISGERSCPVTNWGLVCELPGLCEGEIIHEDLAETIVNCESQCNAFTGCNAYTFDSANKYCMLIQGHCAVTLDGDDLFVTGGNDPFTYIYYRDTMQWEFQREMPNPRNLLMCGLVHNEAGEQEVVAAGGYGSPGESNVVEIFNVRSGQWRSANPLPRSIEGAAVVPLDDTFLIVGGLAYSISGPASLSLDTIYKYNQADDSWTLQEAKLPYPVAKPVAMMVDRDIFTSC